LIKPKDYFESTFCIKGRRVLPHHSPSGTYGHDRLRAARLKEAGAMEFVFVLLVVTLLVILPLLFFVVMLGGLFDGVRRTFRGSKSK
jgi:hypothetical protein